MPGVFLFVAIMLFVLFVTDYNVLLAQESLGYTAPDRSTDGGDEEDIDGVEPHIGDLQPTARIVGLRSFVETLDRLTIADSVGDTEEDYEGYEATDREHCTARVGLESRYDVAQSEVDRRHDRDEEEEISPVEQDTRERIVLIALSIDLCTSCEEEDKDQDAYDCED